MPSTLSRRSFLQVGTSATLGAAVSPNLLRAAAAGDPRVRDDDQLIPTVCEICFWKCGLQARVRDRKVVALEGNPHHPLSRGKLCPRGAGGLGTLYDPDRLSKPLIRTGKRGEPQAFREATWEEALDRVAAGMRGVAEKYGPESVALFYHGCGGSFWKTLFKAFGSPNVAAPSYAQCRGPRDTGFNLTFGDVVGSPEVLDMQNSRCIVLLGSHLGENMHNTQVQDFAEAMARGAKLIAVDPRFSTAAGKADYWLPIRPGTDLALLLGWTRLILEEGWYDRAYVQSRTIGLEQLRAEVARYTPEAVFTETGVRPDDLRAAAREMADASPHVVVHPGRRTTWYGDDAQRSRAIAILNALLGSWGRRGGFYLPSKASLNDTPGLPEFPERKAAADNPEDKYPFSLGTLANGLRDATLTGKPYPIKSWVVYGSNLPIVLPNPAETYKAMQELEFMVAIDILPAEITGWADVVLPECTYLERHDDLLSLYYREPFVSLRQPVTEPLGEAKEGWWMVRELARRLDLDRWFPWEHPDEMVYKRLENSGYSAEEQRRLWETGVIYRGGEGIYLGDDEEYEFDTPSGKIELYSQQLADAGFDPVPVYRRVEMPAPGEFRLLFGRSPVHTFGRTANNSVLLEQFPENELWLNRVVASDLEIANGDRVLLRNQDGATAGPIKVKVTERIRSDCVYMVHGFGHKDPRLRRAFENGANDADLVTRYKVDPLMGGTGMNVNFVTLEKVEA